MIRQGLKGQAPLGNGVAELFCSQCKIVSKRRLEKGMCHTCYERQRRAAKPLRFLNCLKCGPIESKKLIKNLCASCYSATLKRRKISICHDCLKEKFNIFVKGLCQACYSVKNRAENPETYSKYQKVHREKILKRNRIFRQKYPELHTSQQAFRRAMKFQATSKWGDKGRLKEIYRNCPSGMHVDHIIPLKNELVCGLHVPENLQYLSFEENVRKSNKFDGTYENENWRKS